MTHEEGDLLVIVSGNLDDPACPGDSNDYHHYRMGVVVKVQGEAHEDGCLTVPVDPGGHNYYDGDERGDQWVEWAHVVPHVDVDLADPAAIEKWLEAP